MISRNPLVPLYSVATVNDNNLPESTADDEVFSYVDISGVEDFSIIDDLEEFRFADAPSRARRRAVPGDVIVSTVRTYLKAVAPVHEKDSEKVFSTGFAVIRPNRVRLVGGYLKYAILSTEFLDEVSRNSNGVSYPAINSSVLMQIRIPLPPVDTQKRIADYLDKETAEIDAMVSALDEYVELLEKRKKLSAGTVFTSDIQNYGVAPLFSYFTAHNGDRGENYPSADEIVSEGIPFVNAGDLRAGSIVLDEAKFVTEDKYNSMGGVKLQQGDIAFCLRGSLGKHGVVPFNAGTVASSLCVFRGRKLGEYHSNYLNCFLDSVDIEQQILFAETGSAQPNLSAEAVLRFRVPAAPYAVQEQSLRELQRIYQEAEHLVRECNELRDLLLTRRQVLISDVVSGKKEV